MKKVLLTIAMLLPLAALAQQAVYLYQRAPGETVIFAWDHEPLRTNCGAVARGATQMVCADKTYPVAWAGGQVKITGFKSGGGDVLASVRYKFRGIKTSGAGIAIPVTGPGTYTFTIPSAGRYVAWGYVALDDTGSMDSFLTSMDGAPETIWRTLQGTPGQWGWDRINADGVGVVVYDLKAGAHTLTITEREAGTQINGIVILAENSTVPVIDEQVFQGETEANTTHVPLSFGAGLIRMEFQTIQTWDGVDKPSAWAHSDDANVATVDQAARGWLVRVESLINDVSIPQLLRLIL